MAIYHRNKEKWNPFKIRAKTSKNRSYEINRKDVSGFGVIDLQSTVWDYLTVDNEIVFSGLEKRASTGNSSQQGLHGFRNHPFTNNSTPETGIKITNTRGCKAIDFTNNIPLSNTQTDHPFIRQNQYSQYTPAQLFGYNHTTTSQPGSRYIFFSYWLKIDRQNAASDGHTFAQWGLEGSGTSSLPHQIDPVVSFYVNGSGSIAIRFCEIISSTDDFHPEEDAGEEYMLLNGPPTFIEVASPVSTIEVDKWYHVVFGLNLPNGWATHNGVTIENQLRDNTELWINGHKVNNLSRFRDEGGASFGWGISDGAIKTASWEWQFGSLVNGLGSYSIGTNISSVTTSVDLSLSNNLVKVADATGIKRGATLEKTSSGGGAFSAGTVTVESVNTSTSPHEITVAGSNNATAGPITFSVNNPDTIRRSSGFSGLLGEFTIVTQHCATEAARNDFAKFLKEAQTDGVYALHSGAHNSDPYRSMIEQAKKSKRIPNKGGNDQHRLTTLSGSMFEEGAGSSHSGGGQYVQDETWDGDASKFFIANPATARIFSPLGVQNTDPLISNFFSEERSVIFSADTDNTTGLIRPNPYNKPSDQFYGDKITTQTIGPFNDFARNPRANVDLYKDTFVIDIPLSYGSSTTLTTSDSSEAPMFAGGGATTLYKTYDFGFVAPFQNQNITMGMVMDYKWYRTTTHPTHGTAGIFNGWKAMNYGGTSIEAWELFGFATDTVSTTPADLVRNIDVSERLVWLKIITALRFYLQQLFGNIDEAGFTLNQYTNAPATTKAMWDANTLQYNIIRTIFRLPTVTSSFNFPQYEQTMTSSTGHYQLVHALIYIFKNYDTGFVTTGHGTKTGGNIDQLPHPASSAYWQEAGGLNLNTISAYSAEPAATKYAGFFVSLPDDIHRVVQQTSGSLPGIAWWSPAKAPIYTTDLGASELTIPDSVSGSGTITLQNPNQSFTTMAYHNFSTGKWEPLTAWNVFNGSWKSCEIIKDATIGFSPMTSVPYPIDRVQLEEVIDAAGRPTNVYGFPFHTKFKASNNQTLDLAQYLDEPVILNGWEIKVDVVPQVGVTNPISFTPSPNVYFAGGEANTFFNYKINSQHVNWSNNSGAFGTTVPTETGTPNYDSSRYANTSPGQVTKGVTAFLLKQGNTFGVNNENAEMYYNQAKRINIFTNCVESNAITNVKKPPIVYTEDIVKEPTQAIGGNSTISNGPMDGAFFTVDSSRELLGYLQQIYHNDSEFTGSIDYKGRVGQMATDQFSNTAAVYKVKYSALWDREKHTFIPQLNSNTSTYEFHVSGSVKLNKKIENQSYFSPFVLRMDGATSTSDIYFNGNKALNDPGQPLVLNYTFQDSYFGGTGIGELSDGYATNSVTGKTPGDTITLPSFAFPNSGSIIGTPTVPHQATRASINPSEPTDVILYPTDKLILGIQDSISTTLGSQVIDSTGALWKWGRQKLEIEGAQKDSYLRLYLQRRQKNIPHSVISNQSHGFSDNISTDLGDKNITDQYEVAPIRMYSGSMADDIVEQAPFNPSTAFIRISFGGSSPMFRPAADGTAFSGTAQVIPDHPAVMNRAAAFSTVYGGGTQSGVVNNGDLSWIFLNEEIFKQKDSSGVFQTTPSFTIYDGAFNSAGYDNPTWEYAGSLQVGLWPISTDATKVYNLNIINSRGMRTYAGASYLWEINRNPGRSVPTDANKGFMLNGGGGTNVAWPTGPNEKLPVFSAWSFTTLLPVLAPNRLDPSYLGIKFKTRLIALDQTHKPQAYNPSNSSWETLKAGDFFFFSTSQSDAVKGSWPIKVWDRTSNSHTGASWGAHTYLDSGQYHADIYCVAAEGNAVSGLNFGSLGLVYHFESTAAGSSATTNLWSEASGHTPITWNYMMDSIKGILSSEVHNGLNYTITDNNPAEDWFQIQFLKDDYLNSSLSLIEPFFNNDIRFSLMGTDGSNTVPHGALYSHRARVDAGFDSTTVALPSFSQYQLAAGTTVDNTTAAQTVDAWNQNYLRTSAITGATNTQIKNQGYVTHNTPYIGVDYGYLPYAEGMSLEVNLAEFTVCSGSLPSSNGNNSLQAPGAIAIDRAVKYRMSEGTAGPFGALNKFNVTSDSSLTYIDSVPRDIFDSNNQALLVNNDTINLTTPVPFGWLMGKFADEYLTNFENIDKIEIPVSTNSGNNIATPNLPGTRQDMLLENINEAGDTVGFSNTLHSDVTINLTNQITSVYPLTTSNIKSVYDSLFGFGNGPQSRLIARPNILKNNGTRIYAYSPTQPGGANVSYEFILDPIRGVRQGFMNNLPLQRKYYFSRRNYGQFASILGSDIDSQFSTDPTDEILGAVCTVTSVDTTNPSAEADMMQNKRRNKQPYQRMAYPLFDDPMNGILNQSASEVTYPDIGPNPLDFPGLVSPETYISYNSLGVQQSAVQIPSTSSHVSLVNNIRASSVTAPGALRAFATGSFGP